MVGHASFALKFEVVFLNKKTNGNTSDNYVGQGFTDKWQSKLTIKVIRIGYVAIFFTWNICN